MLVFSGVLLSRCRATLDDCHRSVCELQALFNYFSCSAVAIATLVGGGSATMVTALTIAAHLVSILLLRSVATVTQDCSMSCVTQLEHLAVSV